MCPVPLSTSAFGAYLRDVLCGTPGDGGTSLHSSTYHLISADLRQDPSTSLGPLTSPSSDLARHILSPTLPTLLLAECVLPYMSPAHSLAVLQWATRTFERVGVVTYEMFGLGDAFGSVMRENLAVRALSSLLLRQAERSWSPGC